ncbi:MAG: FAD-binding oxidoreductase [Chloroflexi bacterium]|nr:FAD-binding oxidoreductase [Chloroflexota bacterium]
MGQSMVTVNTADLQHQVTGQVLGPEDAGYGAARQAWNLTVDQRPAVVLMAATADDVAAGVRFAAASGLGVAVQATGHGVLLPADDALLILTSGLNEVTVDAETGTAWVSAGAVWGDVLAKTHPLGLTPLLGSSPGVGAVSYTLGGGMGWLARKYGMASDSVLEFEVVTGTGEIVHASADENPDLFWGLRGGGKGLAIVTRMCVRLFPVTTVYGGTLYYPIARAREAFAFFRNWTRGLPDEWTTSIAIMHFPPIPEMPDFLRGRSFVMVNGCYTGDPAEGQEEISQWKEWAEPLVDAFHPMPFSEVGTISNDPMDPTPGISSGLWLGDLEEETIDLLLRHGAPNGSVGAFLKMELRHAGGAIARTTGDSGAYSHRAKTLLVQVVGLAFTPEHKAQVIEAVASMKRDLRAHTSGAYMNFLEGHEAYADTRLGFSDTALQRLRALKARFDPENRFRYGFNLTG